MNKTKKSLGLLFLLFTIGLMIFGVSVKAANKKIALNKTKATVTVGKSLTLKLNNVSILQKKTIQWFSSNHKIATVTNKGKVTTKKAGNVVITAKYKGKKYKCKLKVIKKESKESDDSTDDSKEKTAKTTTEATTEETKTVAENGTYTTKDDVALYIHTYKKLPKNFITKDEAKKLGWSGGSLEKYAPGKSIGGDYFGNYEGKLPKKDGRTYHECDIDTKKASSRGAKRIVFSDDGLVYYTEDHYETFTLLYGQK